VLDLGGFSGALDPFERKEKTFRSNWSSIK